MKSLLTVSGVVFAHICVFLLLVNGCRGPVSEREPAWRGDTSVYSGGARSAAQPAQAVPAKSEPAVAVPASATPATATPAAAQPVPATAQPASAAPAADATPAEPGKEKLYRVQKGDMLSTLAVRFGVTAKDIADANGIGLNDPIYEGKTLKIPAQKPKSAEEKAKAEGEIYVVAKGDVLGTIARKHKVTVAQLKKANNLKSDKIRVGQKLVIPSKTAAAEKTESESAAPANAAPAEAPANAVPANAAPAESKPAETKSEAAPEEKKSDGALEMPELRMLEETTDAATAPAEPAPAAAVPATSVPAAE